MLVLFLSVKTAGVASKEGSFVTEMFADFLINSIYLK